MPNHIHGIIIIENDTNNVETLHAISLHKYEQYQIKNKNQFMSNISPKTGSLSTIIHSYKSVVTKNARKINKIFAWQTRFMNILLGIKIFRKY